MTLKRKCYICGRSLFLEHHHIIPKAKGGSDDQSNIANLCPTCHRLVHHRIFDQDYLFQLKREMEYMPTAGDLYLEGIRNYLPGNKLLP